MDVAGNVGTTIAAELTKRVIRRRYRQWKSLFEGRDAGNLPAADNGVDRCTDVRSERLTLSDGELVDVADYEAVRDIGAIDGFFGGKVVVVANAGRSGIGPAVVAFNVVDELRERVRG